MAENEKQWPVRQSLFASLRKDGHWKCLCLSSLIIGCLVAITWCHLTIVHKKVLTYMDVSYTNPDRLGPCKEGYIYIPVAFVIMLYLVYLVECWHSHSRLELSYKCDIGTVYSAISRMQNAMPVIWWKATCYHYVRRTRHVLRYRNGDAFTSTQVYYERVDSKTAGAAYNYSQCGVKDISRPLTDLEKYPAIKIKISKGFSFANLDTEFDFEEQRAQFFQEYETKDDYMEGREGMDLVDVDFKEYMIAFRDPDRLPWYVSHSVFWVASLALMSWPLRAIIEYKTAHLHYHIHKLFGSNYLDAESYPALMSRVSTMNSMDLEMSIRNNNVIVPTYSEAVLADAQFRRDYGAIKSRSSSRFPRSLTNVTLASRASSAARPLTPAVTMNQVKKFKSCSAFCKSDSTESAFGGATVRHQIQQLIRDRSRVQNKISRNSCSSTSGISIANGNVRFHVGSPVSPDGSTLSHSFSAHSVTSFRGIGVTQSDACVELTDETVRSSRPKYQMICSQNGVRPKNSNKHKHRTSGSIMRSKSVPGSATGVQGLVNSFQLHPIDSPLEASTSSDTGPSFIPSKPIPTPTAKRTKQLTSPAACPPPSPPAYDVAIKMKRITSPCRMLLNSSSVPASCPRTHAEIGLTDPLPATLRTQREITAAGSRGPCDRKQGSDSIISVQSVAQIIDTGLSQVPYFGAASNYEAEARNIPQASTAKCDQNRPDSQTASQSSNNQQSPRPLLPSLKPLPKVCIPSIDSESEEESDSEYLQSAVSELGSLENVPPVEEQTSVRVHQRSIETDGLRLHATSRDARLDRLALSDSRDTPSTSVASAAVALVHSQRRQQSGHHKETPV